MTATCARPMRSIPAYGFASHVGYITPAHTKIVRERGPCEIHRRSWRARAYLPERARRRRRRGVGRVTRRAACRAVVPAARLPDPRARTAGSPAPSSTSSCGAVARSSSARSSRRAGRRSATRSRWSTRTRCGGCSGSPTPGSPAIRRRVGSKSGSTWSPSARAARARPERVLKQGAIRPRRTCRHGRHAGADLRRPRPRPLLVGARPARARAHEARPPAPSVSRQVHPAARRGALPPSCPRRAGACSIRSPGSGTTLVQALESGLDSVGVDIAAFNCLLMRVKTASYNPFVLERDLRDALARFERARARGRRAALCREVVRAGGPATSCCASASLVERLRARRRTADRARARRAVGRRTTHFDLDFPRTPQVEPYWCFKHKRECRPVDHADHFIRRYTLDTLARLKEFARVRTRRSAEVLHGDARELAPARELRRGRHLAAVSGADRLPRAAPVRLRAARPRRPARARDRCRRARHARGRRSPRTSTASRRCSRRAHAACAARGRVVIVVNDRRELYPEILERAGLSLEQRYQRHVNRRTGRRAGRVLRRRARRAPRVIRHKAGTDT